MTLEDLVEVIHAACSPSPIACTVENIHDVKSWLRPYVTTLQHRSNPHTFQFKLNENGAMEVLQGLGEVSQERMVAGGRAYSSIAASTTR